MFFKYCQSIKNTDSFCSSSSGQRKTHTQAKGRLAGETDPRTTCRVSAVPRVPDKRRSTSGARGHRRHGWGPTNYHSPPEAGTVTLWALAAATINQASCPHSVSSANQQWAIFPSWLATTASKTHSATLSSYTLKPLIHVQWLADVYSTCHTQVLQWLLPKSNKYF